MSFAVEFGSQNAADKARDERFDGYVCPLDDDGRYKTVHFKSDTPDSVRQQIDAMAVESDGADRSVTAKLGQATRDAISDLGGFDGNITTANWRSAKGVFRREGIDSRFQDSLSTLAEDYDDPIEGAEDITSRLKADGERTGTRDVGEEDVRQQQKEVDAARTQLAETCDHARKKCKSGLPGACEYLQESCGYSEDEAHTILGSTPSTEDQTEQVDLDGSSIDVTPAEAGALKRSWRGYKSSISDLSDSLDTIRESVENAERSMSAVNGIRESHGQDDLHPDRLHELLDSLRGLPESIPETRTLDHFGADRAATPADRVDVYMTVDGQTQTAQAIRDSEAKVGIEALTTSEPQGLEFVDYPFNAAIDRQSAVDAVLSAVERHEPEVAVAPDVEEGTDLETAVEIGDQMLERGAESVVIVPKAIHPAEVPDRFRVGIPNADWGGSTGTLVSEYAQDDVGDCHVLGGSPQSQLDLASYGVDVASVDGSAVETGAQNYDLWYPESPHWRYAGGDSDYYDRVTKSLNNVVKAWDDVTGGPDRLDSYEKGVAAESDPEAVTTLAPDTLRDNAQAQLLTDTLPATLDQAQDILREFSTVYDAAVYAAGTERPAEGSTALRGDTPTDSGGRVLNIHGIGPAKYDNLASLSPTALERYPDSCDGVQWYSDNRTVTVECETERYETSRDGDNQYSLYATDPDNPDDKIAIKSGSLVEVTEALKRESVIDLGIDPKDTEPRDPPIDPDAIPDPSDRKRSSRDRDGTRFAPEATRVGRAGRAMDRAKQRRREMAVKPSLRAGSRETPDADVEPADGRAIDLGRGADYRPQDRDPREDIEHDREMMRQADPRVSESRGSTLRADPEAVADLRTRPRPENARGLRLGKPARQTLGLSEDSPRDRLFVSLSRYRPRPINWSEHVADVDENHSATDLRVMLGDSIPGELARAVRIGWDSKASMYYVSYRTSDQSGGTLAYYDDAQRAIEGMHEVVEKIGPATEPTRPTENPGYTLPWHQQRGLSPDERDGTLRFDAEAVPDPSDRLHSRREREPASHGQLYLPLGGREPEAAQRGLRYAEREMHDQPSDRLKSIRREISDSTGEVLLTKAELDLLADSMADYAEVGDPPRQYQAPALDLMYRADQASEKIDARTPPIHPEAVPTDRQSSRRLVETDPGNQETLNGDDTGPEQSSLAVGTDTRQSQGRESRVESEQNMGGLMADTRDDASRGATNETDPGEQQGLGTPESQSDSASLGSFDTGGEQPDSGTAERDFDIIHRGTRVEIEDSETGETVVLGQFRDNERAHAYAVNVKSRMPDNATVGETPQLIDRVAAESKEVISADEGLTTFGEDTNDELALDRAVSILDDNTDGYADRVSRDADMRDRLANAGLDPADWTERQSQDVYRYGIAGEDVLERWNEDTRDGAEMRVYEAVLIDYAEDVRGNSE